MPPYNFSIASAFEWHYAIETNIDDVERGASHDIGAKYATERVE